MIEDTLLQVCAQVSMGHVLSARGYSVGPYAVCVPSEPRARWACVNRNGEVVTAIEIEEHATMLYGLPMYASVKTHTDWSAFGAAKVFVDIVGEAAARSALRKTRMAS